MHSTRFRYSRLGAALAFAALLAPVGCHSSPLGTKMKEETRFESEWRRYLRLPECKAMVIAGDPKGVYVSGVAQGQKDWQEAIAEAYHLCEQRRRERNIDSPCKTFSVGLPQAAK